jgi:hypothetical protein
MKARFFISAEAQRQCFIQTGSKPEHKIITEWNPADFTDADRAMLFDYVENDMLDLTSASVLRQDFTGDTLYAKHVFRASILEGNAAVAEFLSIKASEEALKAAQEAAWYQAAHYKKHRHEDFVDKSIGNSVAAYWQERFNEMLDRTEEAQKAFEAIPLSERSFISINSPGKYDFEQAGLKGWWERYNEGVRAEMEKKKAAAAELEAEAWQSLEDWANTCGSDLLKARLRNDLNWKRLAIVECIENAVSGMLTLKCSYKELEGASDRVLGNPSLEMIETFERAKKKLPTWASISLRRIDVEDYDEITSFDYYNIVGEIGHTKADLVFV